MGSVAVGPKAILGLFEAWPNSTGPIAKISKKYIKK
jgi:hypothetical protein